MALKESRAPWKFVVGHHTMRSVSDHGDTQELVQELLPTLKVFTFQYKISPYAIFKILMENK